MPTSKHDRKPGAAAGDQSEKQRQKHRKKSGQKSVQKSDPKSGRKNSQQKNQKRARDVALVAAWARARCDDAGGVAAGAQFYEEICDRLERQKMDWDHVQKLMAIVAPDDRPELLQDIEDIAVTFAAPVVTERGDSALIEITLFTVPVCGMTDKIDAGISEIANSAAEAMRTCGFSSRQARVAVFPVALPITSFPSFSPNALYKIARLAATIMTTPSEDPEFVETFGALIDDLAGYDQADCDLADDRPDPKSRDCFIGVRFLVGAQMTMTAFNEESAPAKSGLLFGAEGDDEDEASHGDSDEHDRAFDAWDAALNSDAARGFRVEHPLQWASNRAATLKLHVDQNIAIARAMHDKIDTLDDIPTTLRLFHDAEGLTIDAAVAGEPLVSTFIPNGLMCIGAEDFLNDLFDQYAIESAVTGDQTCDQTGGQTQRREARTLH